MAQIPRPFQLALVAVVLLAGVWLFALQGHSSNPTTASSTAAPEVTSTVSAAPSPARTGTRHRTSSIHSSVGRTSAGTKHAARSGNATHAATPARTSSSHTASPAAPQHRAASATSSPSKTSSASGAATHAAAPVTRHAAAPVTRHAASATKNASALATPTGQREVEGELKRGKIVVLLFWNPAGSDDQIVHKELQLLLAVHHLATKAKAKAVQQTDKFFGLELDKQIAVHEAHANQVAGYGSITRGVQIYATPTLLVINPKGQAVVRTGLTDAYAIEQAIEEARAA